MSGENSEYKGEAPPRQEPGPSIRNSGELVTLYQAQQGAGESFPVLQAFQEYIEAERKQARRRVVQLSIGFAAILGVVVVGFLLAGVTMLNNMTSMQSKLVEVVAARTQAPAPSQIPVQVLSPPPAAPAAPGSPALEESIREMSRVLAALQEKDARAAGEPRTAPETPRAPQPPANDPAVDALKAEMLAMKEQSRKLEQTLHSLRGEAAAAAAAPQAPAAAPKPERSSVVEEALAIARRTAQEKEASDKVAAEKAAAEAAHRQEQAEKARLTQLDAEKTLAVQMAAERVKADREALTAPLPAPSAVAANAVKPQSAGAAVVSRYPAPVKDAPAARAGVTAPAPPENMTVGAVQLTTREGERIPWRIFMPE
jgi:hypothetical protein